MKKEQKMSMMEYDDEIHPVDGPLQTIHAVSKAGRAYVKSNDINNKFIHWVDASEEDKKKWTRKYNKDRGYVPCDNLVEMVSKSEKNPGRVYMICDDSGQFCYFKDDAKAKAEFEKKKADGVPIGRPSSQQKKRRLDFTSPPPSPIGGPEMEMLCKRVESIEGLLHKLAAKILVPAANVEGQE